MSKRLKRYWKIREMPIEEHSTAAWANIEQEKPVSKVPIPSYQDMELAREWVNQNQK